jgi:hypothetical protein
VEEGVRGASVVDETEQLAWDVLRAANRTQAKGSTARLIVPRAPEVAEELGMDLTDAQFLSVEEYLLKCGYTAPANIGLSWGTYTITPTGFSWLEGGLPVSSTTDQISELAERPSEEAAFESALRAELEEERRRLEEVERELDEEPPRGTQSAGEGQERAEPRSSTGGTQDAIERPWWRRLFGRAQ